MFVVFWVLAASCMTKIKTPEASDVLDGGCSMICRVGERMVLLTVSPEGMLP